MKRFHAKRLLKLARFLKDLPRKRFDINTWFDDGFKADDCGTTACAMGWACTLPTFKKAGLRQGRGNEVRFWPTLACDRSHHRDVKAVYWYEDERRPEGVGAARLFFGLTRPEAKSLFLPDGYEEVWIKKGSQGITPKMVAKKIVRIVKQYHPDLLKKAVAK